MNQERYYTIRERPHGLSTSILTTRGSFQRPNRHSTPLRITAIDQIEANRPGVLQEGRKGGLHSQKRHPHDPELLSLHSTHYSTETEGDRLLDPSEELKKKKKKADASQAAQHRLRPESTRQIKSMFEPKTKKVDILSEATLAHLFN